MMPSKPKPKLDNCKHILVVEGYSDLLFYSAMMRFAGAEIVDKVFIENFKGVDRLKSLLETFITPERLADWISVAIILDADEKASDRIQSVSDLLTKITGRQLEHGTWSKGQPNLGFFVVPNGHQQGEVETLAWNAWANDPQNSEPKDCIEKYLNCMAEKKHVAHSPDKGKIGALLAVMYDEDPRLGPGARENVFDFSRPEFEPLLNFLRGFAE